MDIARGGYTTRCRFLRHSEVESTIKWIEVPDTVPALPYASAISSQFMSKDYDLLDGVGEVRGAPVSHSAMKAPQGFNGKELCGTRADFEEGGEYLPNVPPAVYDSQGFLACCKVPVPPPPPTPWPVSTFCNTPFASLGVTYKCTFTPGFGGLVFWVGTQVQAGKKYRVTWGPTDTPAENWTGQYLYYGDSCGFSWYQGPAVGPPGATEFTIPFGHILWLTWTNVVQMFTPQSIVFRFDLIT